MNNLENTSEVQEKELELKISKVSSKKWQIWRLIAVGIFLPFVGPYIPMRRGTLAERMGYHDSALLFGVICIIAIPLACYMHIQKINAEVYDIEWELEQLQRKKKQSNVNENMLDIKPNS